MRPVDTNPFLESVREAYRRSPLHRSISGGEPIPATAAAALPKVEYRPDMSVEGYERYLADLANP